MYKNAEMYRATNAMVKVLGHKYFLSDSQIKRIPSVRSMFLAWQLEELLIRDSGFEIGIGSTADWKGHFEKVPAGKWKWISELRGLEISTFVSPDTELNFHLFERVIGRSARSGVVDGGFHFKINSFTPDPTKKYGGSRRTVIHLLVSHGVNELPSGVVVKLNPSLFKNREDRLLPLYQLDKALNGEIVSSLKRNYTKESPDTSWYLGQIRVDPTPVYGVLEFLGQKLLTTKG